MSRRNGKGAHSDRTGQIELELYETMRRSTNMSTAIAHARDEGLIDAIAEKLDERRGRFLGLDRGGWTTLLFGAVIAALAAFGGWQVHLRDRVNGSAPQAAVDQNKHDLEKVVLRVAALEGAALEVASEVKQIRASQIRLEAVITERVGHLAPTPPPRHQR